MALRTIDDAQRLQRYAMEALTEVKDWASTQHALSLPGGGLVTGEQAEGYARYLEWLTRLDAALQTLEPVTAEQQDDDQRPPFGL